MMIPIHLEEGRREAGQKPIHAPVLLHSKIQREDKTVCEVGFDVSHVHFSPAGLPAMPFAGDVLCVMPENCQENIQKLILSLMIEESVPVFLKGRFESDEGNFYDPEEAIKYVSLNPVKLPLLQALEAKLNDLSGIPPKWAEGYQKLRELLALHLHHPDACRKHLKHTHVTDVLAMFPGLLTLQELCTLQGAVGRRVYTIASIKRDKKGNPQRINILLASDVSYTTPKEGFGRGGTYRGVCNAYLSDLLANPHSSTATVFVQRRKYGAPEKNRAFSPYSSPQPDALFLDRLRMPLLMIAAGSGISGINAVLEERLAWKQKGYEVGTAKLLFGIHNREKDYLYEQLLKTYQEEGLLEKVLLAESRPSAGKKQYVQHLLVGGDYKQVFEGIVQAKHGLVLCGDWKMGQSVLFGCLPFLLPFPLEKDTLDDTSTEARLESLFLYAKGKIQALREEGIIQASASGTRHAKRPFTFKDAMESLRKLKLDGLVLPSNSHNTLSSTQTDLASVS